MKIAFTICAFAILSTSVFHNPKTTYPFTTVRWTMAFTAPHNLVTAVLTLVMATQLASVILGWSYPYLQQHAVIEFNNEKDALSLINAGLGFGLGYNFDYL